MGLIPKGFPALLEQLGDKAAAEHYRNLLLSSHMVPTIDVGRTVVLTAKVPKWRLDEDYFRWGEDDGVVYEITDKGIIHLENRNG